MALLLCSPPAHALCPQIPGIVVQVMSRKSQILVYKDSQNLGLRPHDDTYRSLLQIPYEQIHGCRCDTVEMEGGGLLIMDARLAFTIIKGFAIHFVFSLRRIADGWEKMKIARSADLSGKVEAMNASSRKVETNFIFH
ncbi:MAG: hypothetical protein M1814_000930 [Vezdaea aestivalis]|nr:MAG: hypothetical protein M1814_000930 [Vezdaea aestivalis]